MCSDYLRAQVSDTILHRYWAIVTRCLAVSRFSNVIIFVTFSPFTCWAILDSGYDISH